MSEMNPAFDVVISGRDLAVAARLMSALTAAGLLSPDVIWQDFPAKIILHVSAGTGERRAAFQRSRFPTFDQNGGAA